MSIISIPEFDHLPPEAKSRYQDQVEKHGRITNMKRTLLHAPTAFDALMSWYPLFDELKALVGERAALFYAYAISTQNECLICSTFFVKILKDQNISFDEFAFSTQEKLLIDYGREIVSNPHKIDETILSQLQKQFDESGIVLLTAFAGLMIATNLINTALNVPLDEYLFEYSQKA
ncbi:hypothetical protein [Serratia sp. UGAL515B_01]|uniref:carboxymuconolactone decarboxylase family protein n=1 Tax=Serratia sp. UGAL515B_01 TaxID=2986763 RepID=UPI0029542A7E|nr:hypothetical protein [Serratia sp. UGAL515B_01]WON78303.1 hypothetical protein OK023_06520 [Serratia sp. UGAL515B_01]